MPSLGRAAGRAVIVASALLPVRADAVCFVREPVILLSPSDGSPVPTNARVTVAILRTEQGNGHLVLRSIEGPAVSVSETRYSEAAADVVVLTPDSPLLPNTRYEIAVIERKAHPSTLVFGTFATGRVRDDEPPALRSVGRWTYRDERLHPGTANPARVRVASVDLRPGMDKNRTNATLLYGVWLPDLHGKLDLQGKPTLLLPITDGAITIGTFENCHLGRLDLPTAPGGHPVGLAVFDEAGNRSGVHVGVIPVRWPRP